MGGMARDVNRPLVGIKTQTQSSMATSKRSLVSISVFKILRKRGYAALLFSRSGFSFCLIRCAGSDSYRAGLSGYAVFYQSEPPELLMLCWARDFWTAHTHVVVHTSTDDPEGRIRFTLQLWRLLDKSISAFSFMEIIDRGSEPCKKHASFDTTYQKKRLD
jgi:hypothetical protein